MPVQGNNKNKVVRNATQRNATLTRSCAVFKNNHLALLFAMVITVTSFLGANPLFAQMIADSIPDTYLMDFPTNPQNECHCLGKMENAPISMSITNFVCPEYDSICQLTTSYEWRECRDGQVEITVKSVYTEGHGSETMHEHCRQAKNRFDSLINRISNVVPTRRMRVNSAFQPIDSLGRPTTPDKAIWDTVMVRELNPQKDTAAYAAYTKLIKKMYECAFVETAKDIMEATMRNDPKNKERYECGKKTQTRFRGMIGLCMSTVTYPIPPDFTMQQHIVYDTSIISVRKILDTNDMKNITYNVDGSINLPGSGTSPYSYDYKKIYPDSIKLLVDGQYWLLQYYDTVIIARFVDNLGDTPRKWDSTGGIMVEYYNCGDACCRQYVSLCWDRVNDRYVDSTWIEAPPLRDTINSKNCDPKKSGMSKWREGIKYQGEVRTGCNAFCEPVAPMQRTKLRDEKQLGSIQTNIPEKTTVTTAEKTAIETTATATKKVKEPEQAKSSSAFNLKTNPNNKP